MPNKKYHYSEAYAVFGRGYLKLYSCKKNNEFLNDAIKCANWLINNPSSKYLNYSWGLPWKWKEWNAPKEISYVCTTMYCCDFFLELYKITKDKKFLNISKSSIKWLINENGYRTKDNGVDFYYANIDSLKFSIYNQNALAMSCLTKLFQITKEKIYKKLAQKVSDFLFQKRNNDGSWFYSENSNVIDNFHTALTLEGYIDYLNNIPIDINNKLKIETSITYYQNKMFKINGKARETALMLKKRKNMILSVYNYLNLKYNCIPYARLWSYGSAIRTFSKLNNTPWAKKFSFTYNIANYAIKNLQLSNGAFKFNEKDSSIFIRNEAHIFDGLATLLLNSRSKSFK